MLAAQEAKALEDLNSAFYFTSTEIETPIDGERMEEHIMPYSLRLQALHLQSIGFGDPRRGVSSLYDLGLECREHIGLPSTTKEDRDMWRERLQDLGIRIVNALVEMGDFDTAKRTLLSQLPTDGQDVNTLTRLTLLLLKIGDIATARRLLETHAAESNNMLQALLAVSEGRWEEAVQLWKTMLAKPGKTDEHIIVKQNLAVALLYTGRLPEARKMLEDLVDSGRGFQSLTFNLATIYELSTTNAHASKRGLAARVAKQPGNVGQNWGRNNVDFKL
ncbi:hypothetical protein UCRPC4_g00398 [Phaeomoniella chlamydospora]|uniref:Coatomer subunit epsilon n=1 Tax=Phaeomoniella chlamydospora TaxID=158046 RepID=A0A0G2GZP6_PHACM|nr:hypothetical protein UCRPC4_g00398 [Phaeomoniella chlamydospora]